MVELSDAILAGGKYITYISLNNQTCPTVVTYLFMLINWQVTAEEVI